MAETEGFEPSSLRGHHDFESCPLWPLRYVSEYWWFTLFIVLVFCVIVKQNYINLWILNLIRKSINKCLRLLYEYLCLILRIFFWKSCTKRLLKQPYSNYQSAQLHLFKVLQDFVTAELWTACCSTWKADIGEFIFGIYLLQTVFSKISNIAIMSNACADCCSEIWLSSFYAFRVYFPFLICLLYTSPSPRD